MEVHILCQKFVKPSTPTPNHLRNHKLSFIDHLAPSVAVPLIFFYPANDNVNHENVTQLEKLEKSLSQTLTLFYPFAGRLLKDNFLVDCNDEGAEYLEAKVNGCSLDEIIKGNVDVEQLDCLVPCIEANDANSTTPLVLVQVNVFECGGVAIAVRVSHKLADAIAGLSFINAWATTSRVGLCEVVPPCFDLASLIPVRPDLIRPPVPQSKSTLKIVTKRFVFDKKAISALKEKAGQTPVVVDHNISGSNTVTFSPTRVEVVSAVIWRALIRLGIAKHGHLRPSLLVHSINLRWKTTPPMPDVTSGNFYVLASARFTPDNTKMEMHDLAALVKDAMRETNKRYTNAVLGSDEFYRSICESFEKVAEESQNEEVDVRLFTSWCRVPLYGADFGWGKPSWVSGARRKVEMVSLQDTECGEGVEARITLNEQDMFQFQEDQDIRVFNL